MFTDDELYFIERSADDMAARCHKNIYDVCGLFKYEERPTIADAALIETMDEVQRTLSLVNGIRKKCEARRRELSEKSPA